MNSPESALDQDITALQDLASPASEPKAKPSSERSTAIIGESSVAASPTALKKSAETAGVSADAIDTANAAIDTATDTSTNARESGTGGGSENENESMSAEFKATQSNRQSAAGAPQTDIQLSQSDSFADDRQSTTVEEIALSGIENQSEAKETISSVSAELVLNAADNLVPGTNIETRLRQTRHPPPD